MKSRILLLLAALLSSSSAAYASQSQPSSKRVCETATPIVAGSTTDGDAYNLLSNAAGTFWVSDDFAVSGADLYLLAFSHPKDDGTIHLQTFVGGRSREKIVFSRTGNAGILNVDYHDVLTGSHQKTRLHRSSNGVLTSEWFEVIKATKRAKELLLRFQIATTASGNILFASQSGKGAERPDFSYHLEYEPCSGEEFTSHAERIAGDRERWNQTVLPKLVAEAEAAARAKREAAKASGGGALLRSLIGAAVGAYAGSAAGLDTAGTMDAMMRGAAAAAGNGGVAEGFAKGLTEERAKNDAMEQSMRNAANEGLARGAAEYASTRRGENYSDRGSSGIVIRERPQTSPLSDRERGETSPASNARTFYAFCFAMASPKIILSPVQRITVAMPFSDTDMRNRWGAAVGSRNVTCQTFNDQSSAQAQKADTIRAWPQRTPVHSDVQLTP